MSENFLETKLQLMEVSESTEDLCEVLKCSKCGFEAEPIFAEELPEGKRGLPCPECNEYEDLMEFVRKKLSEGGFEGLLNRGDYDQCGCDISYLAPCDDAHCFLTCAKAYCHISTNPSHNGFCLYTRSKTPPPDEDFDEWFRCT